MGVGCMFRMLWLISILFIATGCSTMSTDAPVSARMSINETATYGGKTIGSNLTRAIENIFHRMPAEASRKHVETVYFVINNLPDGQVMQWQDHNSTSSGSVTVLMTQSYGGSYCRLVNSQIYKGSKSRNISEYACTTDNGRRWSWRPA